MKYLLAILLLASCSNLPKEEKVKTASVTWIRTESAQQQCESLFIVPAGYKIYACAVLEDKHCYVITHPQEGNDYLGHEMRHCFDGEYHKAEVVVR